MKFFHLLMMAISILVVACSNSTDSNDTVNFEDMNIEYNKTGGWINPYSLLIDSSGYIQAYARSHSSLNLLDSNSTSLTKKEKQTLNELFSSFENFEDYYEPEHYYTDGNMHRIILRIDSSSDTCLVYDPYNCVLPHDLMQIIVFMEQKINDLLN